jgi:hypothetical protein
MNGVLYAMTSGNARMRVPISMISSSIVVFDFGDGGKGYLNDLSVGAFDLYAGSSEGLGGFHAAYNAPDATAIDGDYLYIVLTVEGFQCSERFCNFQSYRPFCSIVSFGGWTLEILHIS